MKQYTNLDLRHNQLQFAAIHPSIAAPETVGTDGQMYFNTTEQAMYIWQHTQWERLALVWKGVFDATKSYSMGDIVIYTQEGADEPDAYIAKEDLTPAAWDDDKWQLLGSKVPIKKLFIKDAEGEHEIKPDKAGKIKLELSTDLILEITPGATAEDPDTVVLKHKNILKDKDGVDVAETGVTDYTIPAVKIDQYGHLTQYKDYTPVTLTDTIAADPGKVSKEIAIKADSYLMDWYATITTDDGKIQEVSIETEVIRPTATAAGSVTFTAYAPTTAITCTVVVMGKQD